MYLRDNLQLDGGDHIISKYSNRAPETTVTRKLPKKIKRARTAEQEAAQNARLPLTTPARIFQEQGGIEGIIHEAAKGMYNRGEKWGVSKALRGAMQGLQSGHSSPRRTSDRSRLSLDSERAISDKPLDIAAKITSLELRNKSLAKLLERAVDELWEQQKRIHEQDSDSVADALSLSIAKVQFVQVYLENSTMPLPTDVPPPGKDSNLASSDVVPAQSYKPSMSPHLPLNSAQIDGPADKERVQAVDLGEGSQVPVQEPQAVHKQSPPATPKMNSPSKTSGSSPPRPSLDKSLFSWMLGEDQQKSGFVAPSPFRPDRIGSPSGKLFGDTGDDGRVKNPSDLVINDRAEGTAGKDNDNIFTIGNSKARKKI